MEHPLENFAHRVHTPTVSAALMLIVSTACALTLSPELTLISSALLAALLIWFQSTRPGPQINGVFEVQDSCQSLTKPKNRQHFDAQWRSDVLEEMIRRQVPNDLGLKLCFRCAQIDLEDRLGFSHHGYRSLQVSAVDLHCPVCEMFLKFLPSGVRYNPSTNITVMPRTRRLGYKLLGHREVLFDVIGGFEPVRSKIGGTQAVDERRPPDHRLIDSAPLSGRNLAIITEWLHVCSATHGPCARSECLPSPTRLLDIRESRVNLITTGKKSLSYAILSHCWGDGARLMTTESNVDKMFETIDWSMIPATFKDAITTCRKLNIDYLWIDSLCIIQDSKADWEHECQHMGDYYKNAHLTLSALDAPDSSTGFLHQRSQSAVQSGPDIWIRPTVQTVATLFRDSYLNKRGWTLQERLLSTRILHFASRELLWECQTCSAFESSLSVRDDPVDLSSLVYSEGQDFKRGALHLGPDQHSPSDGAFAVWYRIAKHFSRRSLTFESDRLQAISGVARSIGQANGLTYLAGLWQEDPYGLLWAVDGPSERVSHRTRTCEQREASPVRQSSWSWAGIGYSVSWRTHEQRRIGSETDAKIVQALRASSHEDLYAMAQMIELTVDTVHFEVQCLPALWNEKELKRNSAGPLRRYRTQMHSDYVKMDRNGMLLNIYRDGVMIGTGCFDDRAYDRAMTSCTAMHIAERRFGSSDTKVDYFLLIRPCSQNPGVWKRIGMGMTRDATFRNTIDHNPEFFDLVFEGEPRGLIRLM